MTSIYINEMEQDDIKKLRKRLLNWHYKKAKTISIVDLLESGYQCFRRNVGRRVKNPDIDFREAIKVANEDELSQLLQYRDETKIGI